MVLIFVVAVEGFGVWHVDMTIGDCALVTATAVLPTV